MLVEAGRPADIDSRLPKERRVYEFLDRLGISYMRADHAPAMTMEDCAAIDRALGTSICKNLFLTNRQKTDFYLLLLAGDKPFRTKDLSAQIGSSRLSFAPPEDMERLLGTTPGSASPLGLMNDVERRVRLLIDADVLAASCIGCHPCINTSSLSIATGDLTDKILPALGYIPTVVQL